MLLLILSLGVAGGFLIGLSVGSGAWWLRRRALPPATRAEIDRAARRNRLEIEDRDIDRDTWDREDTHGD